MQAAPISWAPSGGLGGFSLQTQTPVLQLLGLDLGAPCPAFARSRGPKGNFPRGGVQAWEPPTTMLCPLMESSFEPRPKTIPHCTNQDLTMWSQGARAELKRGHPPPTPRCWHVPRGAQGSTLSAPAGAVPTSAWKPGQPGHTVNPVLAGRRLLCYGAPPPMKDKHSWRSLWGGGAGAWRTAQTSGGQWLVQAKPAACRLRQGAAVRSWFCRNTQRE